MMERTEAALLDLYVCPREDTPLDTRPDPGEPGWYYENVGGDPYVAKVEAVLRIAVGDETLATMDPAKRRGLVLLAVHFLEGARLYQLPQDKAGDVMAMELPPLPEDVPPLPPPPKVCPKCGSKTRTTAEVAGGQTTTRCRNPECDWIMMVVEVRDVEIKPVKEDT